MLIVGGCCRKGRTEAGGIFDYYLISLEAGERFQNVFV